MPARIAIEASELRGQTFTCLPGCGFCCLCEPGLSPEERALFEGPLARAVRADGQALRIVGQAGPCAVLDAERKCSAYELRPRGCRSFPFHTTMTWRMQVSLNRGCPGTWSEGAPPAAAGYDPSEALPPGAEALAARHTGLQAWHRFRKAALEAGVYAPPGAVRRRLEACLPLLHDAPGLAAGIALADGGLPVTQRNLRRGIGQVPEETLHRALEGHARATLSQADPRRLPLWVDASHGFRWCAFRLRGDAVERLEVGSRGALRPLGRVPLRPLPLLPRDAGAMGVFRSHAAVFARRDLVIGLAAFLVDRLGYAEPLPSAALRELCLALGDLWLRAGLLARFADDDTIDARRMEAGVAFLDMDLLNAPLLGVAL